ncbi:hypothetical protein [Micromonospora aurantiaca (nom. illeg.)]|uniref:hypothetical protein n=1 Tax=Micromonospora aurantiaca (nom. illeg.) TaxID=47850 RepID=UPI0033CAEA00
MSHHDPQHKAAKAAEPLSERLLERLRRAPRVVLPTLRHHLPVVPDWRCRDCAQPWPCPSSQDHLRHEHLTAPATVFQYLAACYTRALTDLPAAAGSTLHERFLGWLPRRQPHNRTPERRYGQ